MATTMFFEGTLKDAARSGNTVELEFGRSSYLDGISLIYLNIDGKTLILSEEQGRKLYEAMGGLGAYLGYDKA